MSLGVSELLATFDARVERALDAVAKDTAELAKGAAPRVTGNLRRRIRARREGKYERRVTSHAFYGAFVENGRPGITASGKALRFVINGQVLFRKSVGPAEPRPYMDPASRMAQHRAPIIFSRAFA